MWSEPKRFHRAIIFVILIKLSCKQNVEYFPGFSNSDNIIKEKTTYENIDIFSKKKKKKEKT